MSLKKLSSFGVLAIAGALFISGCDLFVGDAGKITITLKDDPFPYTDVSEARITINRIEVKGASGTQNWLVADLSREIDLLTLRDGNTTVLVSDIEIPAGDYTGLRIHLASGADLILSDGTTISGDRGSDAPVIVDVPQFTFDHGEDDARALVDFAMDESFAVQRDPGTQAIESFAYTPVLRTESFLLNDEPLEMP
ncbi:MAG: DUF4382 domain-containing protein [Rhodothermales bacterium]|nr:DUF4382 domain-containing protein [Rhodothermales bacterium]